MAYMALYRQWRPQNFETLVGQQAVKKTLSNALSSGRIAHAYLFTGPRGTGKTSTARILAKALNCEKGPTAHPCGECVNCERITAGNSMDVFEIDAASNRGIEEIKALREQLAFAPVNGRYKIYIIDEVHMLTTEAFNALLKTLEEPPKHVVFILATTDPHKIPATIHSRCQRFDFHRVTVEEITEHLAMIAEKSNIKVEEEALRLIAIQAEGGMRDALSLLDQCSVMTQCIDVAAVREVLGIVGREALRKLVAAIGKQDVFASLAQFHVLLEQGKDVKQVMVEIAEYLRAVLLYKVAPAYEEVYLTDTAEALSNVGEFFGQERLLAAEERLHAAMYELKGTMRPRITAEMCLIDLCKQEGSTIAALAARVELLESKLSAGGTVVTTAALQEKTSLSEPEHETNITQAVRNETAGNETKARKKDEEAPPKPMLSVKQTEPAVSAAPGAQEAKSPVFIGTDNSGDVPTGEQYWKQALELLKAEKKNAIVSCAKPGRVVAFVNNVLQVSFKSPFQCSRMNKEDYNRAFEDVLLRQTRMAIHLQCVVEGEQQSLSTAPAKNISSIKKVDSVAGATRIKNQPSSMEQNPEPEQLPDNLKKASELFGGSIKKI